MARFLQVFSAVFLFASVALGQKRAITEKDLFDFHWIGDVQVAPDGKRVVYVQSQVKEDRSGYETSLYLLDLAAPGAVPQLLLAGTHDSSPRWDGNGAQLAFLRAVEKDGKLQPAQLYVMTMLPVMSAPVRISNLPKGVSNPQWAPSGVVLSAVSLTPKVPAPAMPQKHLGAGEEAHVSDVRVITQPFYQSNGEGYLDPTLLPQLYLLAVPTETLPDPPAQLLTKAPSGVEEYGWANESWILFTSSASAEPWFEPYEHNALFGLNPQYVYPGEKKGSTAPELPLVYPIADKLPYAIRGLSIGPRAAQPGSFPAKIAYHAVPAPIPPAKPVSHQDSDLFTLDLDWSTGTPAAPHPAANLSKGSGYEMGGGVGGDNTAPRGGGRPSIAWSADGTQLLDVVGAKGSALLVAVKADGSGVAPLTPARQAVVNFAATRDRGTIVALVSNPLLIGDLFRVDGTGQTQLTHVNDALFSQLDLQTPEFLQVKPTHRPQDIAGERIDTWVQLPPHFDATQKHPAILNIHGGPHSAYGWIFDHEMLWMAARGYVTIYPNPRGSTTYGDRFANVIENSYPDDDFHDLMDTVDAVVAKGWADPARLGVTGGSGGGLLTDWTVTQTDRFKAAVAQRDIADAAAWWYTSDIGPFHQYWWPSAPFSSPENLKVYHEHSPLTFVNNVKTPMLFILGDQDTRTPPTSGGEVFFRALTYRKIPAVMVRFPRENHELSRSGEPWHRVERLENIVNWFDGYLRDMCEPQYDGKVPCATAPSRGAP